MTLQPDSPWRLLAAILTAAAASTGTAHAVEASLNVTESRLTQGFGDEHSQWLLVSVPRERYNSLLQFSLENKRAFGEHAIIGGVSYGWDASPLDRLSFAVAGSD